MFATSPLFIVVHMERPHTYRRLKKSLQKLAALESLAEVAEASSSGKLGKGG